LADAAGMSAAGAGSGAASPMENTIESGREIKVIS